MVKIFLKQTFKYLGLISVAHCVWAIISCPWQYPGTLPPPRRHNASIWCDSKAQYS